MSVSVTDRANFVPGGSYDLLRVYTFDETCEILKIAPSTLRKIIASGQLRTMRGGRGRGLKITSGDLIDYIYGGDH